MNKPKLKYQPDPRELLSQEVRVHIDRPLGSAHPHHPDLIYPINYGFVPGTRAPDGEEIDAYVLGVAVPLESFTGRCIALLHRINDEDDKLVVVPESYSPSDGDILSTTYFQERYFDTKLIR